MLNSLKRLSKHSAVYGLGHVITRVVNFLLLPLYTNKLSTSEFGASAVVYAFLAVMTIIYAYGIDAAFLRYFILSDDKVRRRRVFSTAFWAIFIVALILTGIIYWRADVVSGFLIREGNYGNLVRLSSLILLFDALALLPYLYLRAEEKSVQYAAMRFVNVMINVGLNVFFIVYRGEGVVGIFHANLWASGLTLVLLGSILLQQVSLQFNREDFKILAKFGLPFLPAALSVVLLDLIDRPLMERLAGLEATGIYNAGAKLGMVMALFVAAFRFAWHPFFLSTSKQADAREIFAKVLTYFTTLTLGIFLFVSFFLDEIVSFKIGGVSLIGESFMAGTQVVPLILLSYVFYGMYVNFMVGIYLEEKTKYLPLITLAGTTVNVVTNVLLIPKIGFMGAGWARLAGHGVMCTLLYLFAQRFYKIDYELGRLLRLAAIVALIFYLGTAAHGPWQNAIKAGLLIITPVLLYLTGFFERRELRTLRNLFSLKGSTTT